MAFAEEEGQRYAATFLGSSALVGDFNPDWLEQSDATGVTLRAAMQQAGLKVDDIAALKRDPADYLGFVEVHIEQGPVLNELDRFHLVMDAIDRLPQTGDQGIYLKQQLKDKLIEHKQYIDVNGLDLPEIRHWQWGKTP